MTNLEIYLLCIVGYLISIFLSWLMFRAAIITDDQPETHPQLFLMFVTFVPFVNLGMSLFGLFAFVIPNSGFDFFKIKSK